MKIALMTLVMSSAISLLHAQKGNNELHGSLHYGIPVSQLKDVSRGGYGGTVKGLFGISPDNQQLTLSAGYSYFPVRKSLSGGFDFFFATLPVMGGYRFTFGPPNGNGGVYIEAEAGINFNTVKGSGGGATVRERGTSFVFATGVGYEYKQFDINIGYQSADVKSSDNEITFVKLALGYSLSFKKSPK